MRKLKTIVCAMMAIALALTITACDETAPIESVNPTGSNAPGTTAPQTTPPRTTLIPTRTLLNR